MKKFTNYKGRQAKNKDLQNSVLSAIIGLYT